jgi:hypothetical protein
MEHASTLCDAVELQASLAYMLHRSPDHLVFNVLIS